MLDPQISELFIPAAMWQSAVYKCRLINKLLISVRSQATYAVCDIIIAAADDWMPFGVLKSQVGNEPYGDILLFSLFEARGYVRMLDDIRFKNLCNDSIAKADYLEVLEDLQRGKHLLRRIFDRAEPLGKIRRMIACSEVFSAPSKNYVADNYALAHPIENGCEFT